jgi:hypothetical protein
MALVVTGKNRIMIFGPKADGTCTGDLDSEDRGACDPARADALRLVRAGRSRIVVT